IDHTALLIGYSFSDYNLRTLLRTIQDRLGQLHRPIYALDLNPTSLSIQRFQRRGVTVIPVTYDTAVTTGDVALSEVFEYLQSLLVEPKRERQAAAASPIVELSKPPRSATNLCLVLASPERLAYYRETLFRSLESVGVSPIAKADVIHEYATERAAVTSLFERARAVFADLNSSEATRDLRLGIAGRYVDIEQPLFLLIEDYRQFEFDLASIRGLERLNITSLSLPPDQDLDILFDAIEFQEWITRVGTPDAAYIEEPRRLLASGEYAAASIAAFRALEVGLRRHFEDAPPPRSFSLRALIEAAIVRRDIPAREANHLRNLVALRNDLVHSTTVIDKKNGH
ncbi:MAG: hypothetical protein QOI11_997, partial [Candidatus Eremiobacteraeota bacterium]|nr:hypothetical protein [Candidatus Eremiobacteraeota bacterium]